MFLFYANLISLVEIVKAKETFPFVIQPNEKKSLGRSSFIIKFYLGYLWFPVIHNTPVNYLLIGSSNADQQWFPNLSVWSSCCLEVTQRVPEATVVILSISMWKVIIDLVGSSKVPSKETLEKILALWHYEKETKETIELHSNS